MKINPDLYHGHDQYTNFFEGWYFKIVDATATYALALFLESLAVKIQRSS